MLIDAEHIRNKVKDARKAAGDRPWAVAYDMMGIQAFVTANGRPKALSGASELLKQFDCAQSNVPGAIFSGGGRGLQLVASPDAARARIAQLKQVFQERTVGGVLAATCVEIDPSREGPSLVWLQQRLEADKQACAPPGGALPTRREDTCEDCGAFRAAHQVTHDERVERICRRCRVVLDAGGQKHANRKSVNDFAERGLIGVVSADGNNMGQLFHLLDSLEAKAAVSAAVQRIFEDAHQEATAGFSPRTFIAPVAGGDDLRILLAPRLIPDYVAKLAEGVERRAREAGDLGGILTVEQAERLHQVGVGIGAVVANSHYPVSRLAGYAHSLEVSAKRICRRRTVGDQVQMGARSAFDFGS